MTNTIDESQYKAARVAGLFYLLIFRHRGRGELWCERAPDG